ncbi:MAG: hypothetical protein K9J38_12325 [Polynucleobacter sp.]|nr:hypothetical protein [Polynucleobacter sp.]
MLKNKFLTLYDFRISPISLGDVLQWIAFKKLEITLSGYTVSDLVIVYPKNFRGNLINEIKPVGYWDSHFREMVKIFESTDFIEKIIITESGIDVDFTLYVNGPKIFDETQSLVNDISHFQPRVWSYIRAHQSFEPFNTYFNQTGERVTIGTKQETVDETTLILDRLSMVSNNLLVCQPRFRMIDKGLPFSDPYRDSIYIEWVNFFEKVDNNCILIGRTDSIPSGFKDFKNVYIAREIGLDIQHELDLLRRCKAFLGASSGFAIAAHFSDVKYKIFGVMKPGFENYGVSVDSENLMFASSFQKITKNEINFKDLEDLKLSYKNRKNRDALNEVGNLYYLICSDFKKLNNQIKIDDLIFSYNKFYNFKFSKLYIFLFIHIFLPIRIFLLKIVNYKNIVQKHLYFGTLGGFVFSKLRKKIKIILTSRL